MNTTQLQPMPTEAPSPVPLRTLRALIAYKGVTVLEVARAAGVPYNTCSGILTGRVVHAVYGQRIIDAVNSLPDPQTV